ncbi:MAG: hypothetical protein CMQ38_05865 [Gammaproteobacteria bacterium]|nr:hypothetical protein [Gammaproteobacteria bacterium]
MKKDKKNSYSDYKNRSYSGSDASIFSNQRFEDLINSTDDWFWEIDKHGRYTFASHQVFHILGYKPEEVLGLTHFDLMPRSQAQRLKKTFEPIFSVQQPFRLLQNYNLHKDGHMVCLETSGNPFYDHDKKFMGYRGIDRDITARKKIEKANEDLLLALDQMAEAALVVATDLKIIYVNKAFYELLGYTPEQIIGEPLSLLNPPEEIDDKKVEFTTSVLNEDGSWEGEVYRRKATGELICVYLKATATRDEDGNLTGYIGTYFDLSDIIQANKNLENTLNQTVHAISSTLAKRDPYTFGHQNHVAVIAMGIAKKLNKSEDFIKGLLLGATIHDIGKVNIPTEILNKSGVLNEYEFGLIKDHVISGFDIVKDLSFPWPIAEMVLQHHERYNGSGYPHGRMNGEIILEAKIIGIADTVQAMASHRPYRPALDPQLAIDEIKKNREVLYDPEVSDAFLDLVDSDSGHQLLTAYTSSA